MAYKKKTWKNRQSEHPNRRKLSPAGESNVYDVQRMEGLVMEEGDSFDQDTMNDLENRVAEAFKEDGVNLYTHKRAGTQHTLTGTGNNIRFAATADFAPGDTFVVNGTVCAAKTAAGDALWSGFFKSGAVVVCWRSGNNLTFNGGGLPGPQAAKLTPENIKSGVSVEVNGKKVDGVFTEDANAAAGDMRASKTAYVNGVKVTGALASRDTGTPNWCEHVRVYNGRFEIAPPAGIHGCYWDGGQYSYLNFDQVRSAIGLTSEKLAEGQQMLGIWGNYKGPSEQILLSGCCNITNSTNEDGSAFILPGQYTNAQYQYINSNAVDRTFNFNGSVTGRLFCNVLNGSWERIIISCGGWSVGGNQVTGVGTFSGNIRVQAKPNASQRSAVIVFGIKV